MDGISFCMWHCTVNSLEALGESVHSLQKRYYSNTTNRFDNAERPSPPSVEAPFEVAQVNWVRLKREPVFWQGNSWMALRTP